MVCSTFFRYTRYHQSVFAVLTRQLCLMTGSSFILLNFSSFDTEPRLDYVTIHVCQDASCNRNARLISSFSGRGSSDTAPLGQLMFAANIIKISFMSDDSTEESGFSVEWNGAASKDIMDMGKESCQAISFRSELSGSVEYMPAAPGGYPADTSCKWIISPPGASSSDQAVQVTITRINTEQSFDTLTFSECNDVMSGCSLLKTLSGDLTVPDQVVSLTGTMEIVFTSDASNNPGSGSGFIFSWQARPRSFFPSSDTCPSTGEGVCPGMDCCRLMDMACVNGICTECPGKCVTLLQLLLN